MVVLLVRMGDLFCGRCIVVVHDQLFVLENMVRTRFGVNVRVVLDKKNYDTSCDRGVN